MTPVVLDLVHALMSDSQLNDRRAGALLGLAVGDALRFRRPMLYEAGKFPPKQAFLALRQGFRTVLTSVSARPLSSYRRKQYRFEESSNPQAAFLVALCPR